MNAPAAALSTRTTCPYCGVGCGVIATPGPDGVGIAGDPDHPANLGRLCSKGSALGETLGADSRLLYPQIHGTRASWDDALSFVAEGFKSTIEKHGPDSVAFYLSGQLLTEDYYVANKLMKGFIGSANVDTNSRLCMSSSVAGHKRVFGSDTVPACYEDLEEADLLVFVGSNAAWCHPVLFRRMEAAVETRGTRMVIIDPRRTASVDDRALHLAITPGTDAILFSGLLVHLANTNALDHHYINQNTNDFESALARAVEIAPTVAVTAAKTGLDIADVTTFFDLFVSTPRAVTLYSQGVNQSSQGTDKVASILAVHLATGRIGTPGCGPFSLTGQPNAMGGREVGGLANQLAAHMGFSEPEIDRVGRFWAAERMATREGLKAVDLFDAVADGRIKALWVMGTNPAVSLPRADAVRVALKKLDLFVVSDVVAHNDTLDMRPDVRLPALAWGEKSGTVTNSERRISRQRSFLTPAGEAKADWWAVCEVGKKLGYAKAFSFANAADIFREHAALSAYENNGTRDFDLGALVELDDTNFDQLTPVQWPFRKDQQPEKRLFEEGGFFTPTGRAHFIAIEPPALAEPTSSNWPLLLNTGRVRDHWHTMTRTGLSPRLASHISEPFVTMHPVDAETFGIEDQGLAKVSNGHGSVVLRAHVSDTQRQGEVFAPIHWNDDVAANARVGALVHAICDPWSGQPDAKATPVSIAPVQKKFAGFILSRNRLRLDAGSIWSWQALADGFATRVETNAEAEQICALLAAHVSQSGPGKLETMSFEDPARGVSRRSWVENGRLLAVLFLGPVNSTQSWEPLLEAWLADTMTAQQRRFVLAGKQTNGIADAGPAICACFGVRRGAIVQSIEDGACTAAEVGMRVKAGTNCGSCLPEIKRILQSEHVLEAAQ